MFLGGGFLASLFSFDSRKKERIFKGEHYGSERSYGTRRVNADAR